jgi:hypothetical protein
MVGTDTSNQQKRRGAASGRLEARIELPATFGLAATITDIFSAGGDFLKVAKALMNSAVRSPNSSC